MSKRDGHDQPCYYCQKPCNGLAANPGVWPVALCHADDPGKVKWHHEACVNERLREAERYKAAIDKARADLIGAIQRNDLDVNAMLRRINEALHPTQPAEGREKK